MNVFKSVIAIATAASISTAVSAQMTEEEIIAFNAQSYFTGTPDITERPSIESLLGDSAIVERPANSMIPPTMSAETKMKAVQTMMAANPMGLRDMMNFMVAKKMVLPGITFDEVIESINSRALDLNMRPTGYNTPYIILRETLDPNSPRLEYLSFCDLITMRMIMDFSLEFGAFLPCSIQVMEDNNGQIWITTLDWDVRWLDGSPNPNRISDDLRLRAIRVRENIESIMDAGANGDF